MDSPWPTTFFLCGKARKDEKNFRVGMQDLIPIVARASGDALAALAPSQRGPIITGKRLGGFS